MNKKYDLVVIGAGLSSLMFLNRYLKKFKKHSVLILESKKNIKKDQTFCVWEGPGLDSIQKNFNLQPKKTWNKILIKTKIFLEQSVLINMYVLTDMKHLID